MERPAIISRAYFRFSLASLLQREIGGHGDECIKKGIEPLDARQALARQFNGRQPAGANLFRCFSESQHGEAYYHYARFCFFWHFSQMP